MKKKPSATQLQKKARDCAASALLLGVTVTQMGCPSPAAPVRPMRPPLIQCPEGAVEAMKQHGLPVGDEGGDADVSEYVGVLSPTIPVHEGPVSLTLKGNWDVKGQIVLPKGSRFSAYFCLGEENVYGFIMRAIPPKGDAFPVCMQVVHYRLRTAGTPIQERKGETAEIMFALRLQTVDHFSLAPCH